jgi:hypothetical protein
MGKVDGIVVRISDDGPPKLAFIETGLPVKARRLSPRLAKWLSRWGKPYRIPWRSVVDIGVDLEVDLDAKETPLLGTEQRLRRLLKKIPGA